MRPVGPEEERVYWIRRGLALVVLLILIIGMGFMISSLGNADEKPPPTDTEAVPSPAVAPTAQPTQPTVPTPAGGVPDDVATEEAVPVPSSAATSPASEQPLPPEPDNTFHHSTVPVPPPPAGAPATSAPPPAPPVPTVAAAVVSNVTTPCDPATTRVAVVGPAQVRADTAAEIKVSATNSGAADCVVIVDDRTFELTIANGGDQVWSSKDCVAALPPQGAVLNPGRTLDWTLQWHGTRSEPQCRNSANNPAAGNYVATAHWREAAPARVNLQLVG